MTVQVLRLVLLVVISGFLVAAMLELRRLARAAPRRRLRRALVVPSSWG